MGNGPRSRVIAEGLRAAFLMLLAPAVFLAIAYGLGTQLPEEHQATASGIVQAPPDRVWELLTDFSAQENWRTGPLLLVRGPKRDANNESCWMEGWLLTRMTLCAVETQQSRKRVVQMLDPPPAFDASWTYTLSPAGVADIATNLTIAQQSFIDSPLERFTGRYLLRRNTAAQQYLKEIQTEALHHP